MGYDPVSYVYEPINTILEVPTGIRKARRELVSLAEGKVLELGVGTGLNLPFYRQGVEVTGVDISEKMLEKARKKRSKAAVKLVKSDARLLPFPDESFDTAVSTFFLCVVPEKEKVLSEVRRVLKPNGVLLSMECSLPRNPIFRALLSGLSTLTSKITGTDFRTDVTGLLKDNGFRVLEEKSLVNGAVKVVVARLPPKLSL
ncbi:class I SAM-dependent methyltransferase [Thermococcus waiotapuensis]|uniref:Methyltransferase domain-containing protein n=1 Tax=Thermococcus waiotapuensis TaxID=90909 RepID=A0AAE4NV53_9EURY|nr:methyltransferase domain-containing protein [Thermococcus waiotapuensis]MDV3103901.1 methyltransferase domain-containing protein [Thermococcus waiotapuensis]